MGDDFSGEMIWVMGVELACVLGATVSFLACPIRCEISDSLASARWSAEDLTNGGFRHDESYTAAMLESPPPDTLGTRLVWRAMCASTYVETCQLRLAQATAPDSHSQWAIPTDEALEQEEYDRWEDYGEQQALSSHMEAYGRLQDDDDDDLGFGRFIP